METSINQRLIRLREAKGLTQAEFARKVEMLPQQINNIEKDKAGPTVKLLQKILELWPDVNMNWLIGGVGGESLAKEKELMDCYRALSYGGKMVVEGFIKQKYGEELEKKSSS